MAKARPEGRLRSGFSLGEEQAELDSLLEAAFYESGHYSIISSHGDNRCFVVARTGGGKSAALRHLQQVNGDGVVKIDPGDISLLYFSTSNVLKYLSDLQVHLDPFFIALWKHVLVVELIRRRYKIDSDEAKSGIWAGLVERLRRDKSKQLALDYFNDFEGRFWDDTDVRLRAITTRLEKKIDATRSGDVGASGVAHIAAGETASAGEMIEERIELAKKFQAIVNETQLSRLTKMIDILDEDILDSEENRMFIVIDDLDRDWIDHRVVNDLIRCLLLTVLDLQRVRNLKVLVALRTNIFSQLDFGRAGAQEEKLRALVLQMKWSKHELVALLDERVKVAAEKVGREHIGGIKDLLPPKSRRRGAALDFILGRTLMRPRDAMAYLNECLAQSAGKPRLTWNVILGAEDPYSYKRLLALRDEWKLTYPGIDRVFALFQGELMPMRRDAYLKHLGDALLLHLDETFDGSTWMTSLSTRMWDPPETDWRQIYHPLHELLFRVGFIGFSRTPGQGVVYAHEDMDYGSSIGNLRDASLFCVHPTFHAALEIKTPS
ncbi:MAG TPA: hypothetical protein VEV43_14000 [Actinomycetota bacterium]|nr:hypothetical protein [Actinomycetota bacterium]